MTGREVGKVAPWHANPNSKSPDTSSYHLKRMVAMELMDVHGTAYDQFALEQHKRLEKLTAGPSSPYHFPEAGVAQW